MFTKQPKSLSSILSQFLKTVDELANLQQFNEDAVGRKTSLIADLQAQTKLLNDESAHAAKIQAKLMELVG